MTSQFRLSVAIPVHNEEGGLIVNLPAGEWAFSAYHRAAGHFHEQQNPSSAHPPNDCGAGRRQRKRSRRSASGVA